MPQSKIYNLQSTILLYGPPGSGKSILSRRLAETLERPLYDLDEIIAALAGQTIPEIFAVSGEAAFRDLESAALAQALNGSPGVIALGGGALLRPQNRRLAETAGAVICLDAPYETLLARARVAGDERPLLQGDLAARLSTLLEDRRAHYASFPFQLHTADLSPDELAWQIQLRLGQFRVSGMGRPYDVLVAPGGLASIGTALLQRGLSGPLAIVSDDNLAPLYLPRLLESLTAAGYTAHPLVIPAGEQHKTVETVQRLWAGFLSAGLERRSAVLALGGGVVTDLAGFAAATYLRGVTWVALPTSLLGMVDASLGGKTGADLPQGKNLVGAFHPPALVLADPQVLATLPEAELRSGLAEVVKHAILADPALFDLCAQGLPALQGRWDEIVRRAIAVKVRVICEDPYESGRRASLNLGHTLGHAIETASEFKISHGQAVATGMVMAACIAGEIGAIENTSVVRIKKLLRRAGLMTKMPKLDLDKVLKSAAHDKKVSNGKIRFVLPRAIGEVFITDDVNTKVVEKVW